MNDASRNFNRFNCFSFLILLIIVTLLPSCSEPDSFSWEALSASKNLKTIFQEKDKYELQILYTQIDRGADQVPKLRSYTYNVDTSRYFYPASTVKMPVAFLALQRLNELRSEGEVNMHTTLLHDSIRPSQSPVLIDTTAINGQPSIAHYINKLFVVSDNDAYNRLYEYCGQEYINEELKQKGIFSNSRIVSRVGISGFSLEDNRYTNPTRFVDENNETILYQKEKHSSKDYLQSLSKTIKGKGYYDDDLDSVVMNAFDMSEKNFINLLDLEASLQRIIFPELFSDEERYDLEDTDYQFLYEAMSRYPKDYAYLKEDTEKNYDAYVKFLMFGDTKQPIPEHIHIFNKVGFAYGYLTDCAYVFDTKNKVEFFLTTTIHVNENQIYNDGKYEYDDIGIPFLAELGRKIYNNELKREKEVEPDFYRLVKTE